MRLKSNSSPRHPARYPRVPQDSQVPLDFSVKKFPEDKPPAPLANIRSIGSYPFFDISKGPLDSHHSHS